MSNIPDWIKDVCKIGQGAECCKYLVMGGNGFECMKFNRLNKAVIDASWSEFDHVAQGDNCPGKENLKDE